MLENMKFKIVILIKKINMLLKKKHAERFPPLLFLSKLHCEIQIIIHFSF